MNTPIAVSFGTIIIGFLFLLSNRILKETFLIFNSQNITTILTILGYVLIGIGAIGFVFSFLTLTSKKKKKKVAKEEKTDDKTSETEEEVPNVEKTLKIYICPFCAEQLKSEEELNKHIKEKHNKEIEETEKPKKVPVQADYRYLP